MMTGATTANGMAAAMNMAIETGVMAGMVDTADTAAGLLSRADLLLRATAGLLLPTASGLLPTGAGLWTARRQLGFRDSLAIPLSEINRDSRGPRGETPGLFLHCADLNIWP